MRVPVLFTSLIFTSFAGCGMTDDDIWMPPSGNGKADGITLVDGASIPSQYVDASKQYLSGRQMGSLHDVGALTGDQDAVALRADGIIANAPANGRLEAAELVRMEQPEIFAALFPDEKAALPMLWKHLEAPASLTMVGAVPAVGDLSVIPRLTPPSGLLPPASVAISALPSELRTVAKRVELVFDQDGNASTIHYTDVEHVFAMPSAFTQAELAQITSIEKFFLARGVSADDASVVVPRPGRNATTVALGAMSLELAADIRIVEERDRWPGTWEAAFYAAGQRSATLTAGANDVMIVLELDTGNERVLHGTSSFDSLAAGDIIFERYVAGARKETRGASLPAFTAGETYTNLQEYLDYNLVLADGTPLVRNPTLTELRPDGVEHAELAYDVAAVTHPNIDAGLIARVDPPVFTIPTGHYSIPMARPLEVDVYLRGVMIAHCPDGEQRMRYTAADVDRGYVAYCSTGAYGDGSWSYWFSPGDNALLLRDSNPATITVTPAHRTR